MLRLLACPVCRGPLSPLPTAVRCERGHSFDVARQGYVNFLTGSPGTADTPAMVAARDDFLGAGHFRPIAEQIAAHCAGAEVIGDAGAGTGHYLAAALGPQAVGLAMDISKHAIRRAARAHPRIGAVVADVWRPLPVRDGVLDVLLNVFAPRNAAEFARVLRPEGRLLVVTPAPGHLSLLVERLGLLTVDSDKERRLTAALGGHFAQVGREEVTFELSLDRSGVAAVTGMGPSAWHLDQETFTERAAALPERVTVGVAVLITSWKRAT